MNSRTISPARGVKRTIESRCSIGTEADILLQSPALCQNRCMRDLTRRAWMGGVALAAQAAGEPPLRLPRTVRLAIIGLEGHISELLEPMNRLPDVELAAIQDTNLSLMDGVRSKYPSARPYTDWRELLGREKLDMVGVCGTNGERAEIILECARRKLHIVAEKPLAITSPDLDRIKSSVAENGIRLTMLISMRFEAQ